MSDEINSSHELYMRRCLELAAAALQAGEAAVGTLIVRGEELVAEAAERVMTGLDVAGHSEVLAVRLACQHLKTFDLSGCILYTSVEPCWMCSYAIRQTGISQVIIGLTTLDKGGFSSKYPILTASDIPGWSPPPLVITGILAKEAAALRA